MVVTTVYHTNIIPSTKEKISVKIKIEISFISRFLRRPIRLVVLVPVGLPLKL